MTRKHFIQIIDEKGECWINPKYVVMATIVNNGYKFITTDGRIFVSEYLTKSIKKFLRLKEI